MTNFYPVIIDIFNPVPYDINILYRHYRVNHSSIMEQIKDENIVHRKRK
jgi:hypothetical protein